MTIGDHLMWGEIFPLFIINPVISTVYDILMKLDVVNAVRIWLFESTATAELLNRKAKKMLMAEDRF